MEHPIFSNIFDLVSALNKYSLTVCAKVGEDGPTFVMGLSGPQDTNRVIVTLGEFDGER